MFTGIVRATGSIVAAAPRGDGLRIAVLPGALDISAVALGDSIAVSGCCLTVANFRSDASATGIEFDVSPETLRCTTGLDRIGNVDLEPALKLSDSIGGHLVSGHVDGVGTVIAFDPVGDRASDGAGAQNRRLEVEIPPELARFIVTKGSITVHGVSLTVNAIARDRFEVNLIPHTLATTTLGALRVGEGVNLEVDLIARHVERLLSPS